MIEHMQVPFFVTQGRYLLAQVLAYVQSLTPSTLIQDTRYDYLKKKKKKKIVITIILKIASCEYTPFTLFCSHDQRSGHFEPAARVTLNHRPAILHRKNRVKNLLDFTFLNHSTKSTNPSLLKLFSVVLAWRDVGTYPKHSTLAERV